MGRIPSAVKTGTIEKCNYQKGSDNWITGCGMRAPYNKFWKYCPYCGKLILNLARLSRLAPDDE